MSDIDKIHELEEISGLTLYQLTDEKDLYEQYKPGGLSISYGSYTTIRGYILNKDNKVTGLRLSHTYIEDIIHIITKFKYIEHLNLDTSYTNDYSFILQYEHLKRLDLSNNIILKDYTFLKELKNLAVLDLRNNDINSIKLFAKLKNLAALDLRGNSIRNLKTLAELKNLTVLNLNNSFIQDTKPLTELINLKALYLNSSSISDLKPFAELKNLLTLDLSFNGISDIKPLAELKNLTTLDLNNNSISSIKPLTELKNLTALFLDNSSLSDTKSLGELIKFTKQNLSRNSIRDASFIMNLYNLREVYLHNNPLTSPPVEIADKGVSAIRDYFKQLKAGEVPLFEAKLLIVGEGAAGKTSLMKKIINPGDDIDEHEITTEGIEIRCMDMKTTKSDNFKINFWDFGGQEIYHSTHQFFLTKRSLYLLVWDARKDDDRVRFDYWLDIIRLLSDNSPVIIVQNKIDVRIKNINEKDIADNFPNIAGFYRISATTGAGIEELTGKIKQELDKLPHIGDKLPAAWFDISDELLKKSKTNNFISYAEYRNICKKHNLDKMQAFNLANYYHDLGTFLNFQDNNILRNTVFLKPEWAKNAVYLILDTKEIVINKGRFHFDELYNILPGDYPEDKYLLLIELMKKFELCFQVTDSDNYIVPELLPDNPPDFIFDDSNNLCFEYHYNFMPSGIISRFISNNNHIIKDNCYWKDGVILECKGTTALVKGSRIERKIKIRVQGNDKSKMLYLIRSGINYIHSTLNNPEVKEMIPCICEDCKSSKDPCLFEYNILKMYLDHKEDKIKCTNKKIKDVFVKDLVEGIEERNVKEIKREDVYCRKENIKMNNDHIDSSVRKDITVEIKNFLVERFSSSSDLDSLCRIIGIKNIYTGISFYDIFTSLTHDLERNYPDGTEKLYIACLHLRSNFTDQINELFLVTEADNKDDIKQQAGNVKSKPVTAKTINKNIKKEITDPIRILHLSDLHIGKTTNPLDMIYPLVSDFKQALNTGNADYLVISGDLTNKASEDEFKNAYEFTCKVCEDLHIPHDNCIIVPGNHDLSWSEKVYVIETSDEADIETVDKESYYRDGNYVHIRIDDKYPDRFLNFSRYFYKPFFNEDYPLDYDDQAMSVVYANHNLQFLMLNSSWQIDKNYKKRSSVKLSSINTGLDKANKQLDNTGLSKDRVLRIAVLHHPVTGNEKIGDDGFIQKLRNENFKIILHGHVHEHRADLVGYLGKNQVYAAGTGSFGAPTNARPESTPRIYYALEVSKNLDLVYVNARQLGKMDGAWEPLAVWETDDPGIMKSWYDINL